MQWHLGEGDEVALQACVGDIVRTVAASLDAATVLTLSGDLGAGKTTFVQTLARAFGITEPVTSPTFVVMKHYTPGHTFASFIHIDAYRFESDAEASPLHLADLFLQPNTLVCIEWPERIASIIPSHAMHIAISVGRDNVRQVTFRPWGS